jgi:hypothetical protein
MKRKFLFVILLSSAFVFNAFGQGERVLAQGAPPLTEALAARVQSVFEFTLSRDFDAAQSRRFRQILVGYWQKNSRGDIQSCLEYLKIADLIERMPADQKQAARQKLRAAIEEAVRKQPEDPLSRLLAEVYNASASIAESDFSKNQTPNSNVSDVGNIPSALIGTWILRKGSGSGYVNPATGTTGGPNATLHSYTFRPNGTFEYALLMQSSLYQCTTAINAYETGTFEADAATVSFYTKKATKSFQDNCRPNLNSSEPAEVRAPLKLYYRLARDEYNNLNLCVAGGNRKETCFVKQ